MKFFSRKKSPAKALGENVENPALNNTADTDHLEREVKRLQYELVSSSS